MEKFWGRFDFENVQFGGPFFLADLFFSLEILF